MRQAYLDKGTYALKRKRALRGGFTLTELAIVVGITGFVLGAIWTAASAAYGQFVATDLLKNILFFQQSARGGFGAIYIPVAGDDSLDDDCGTGLPCGTKVMVDAGMFLPDFVTNNIVTFGGYPTYLTKYGQPVWTGLVNSERGFYDAGMCGSAPLPACPAGSTSIGIILYNISVQSCTYLIMQLVNAHIDGLTDVVGPDNGWGPVAGAPFFGNPTLPASMDLGTATTACGNDDSVFAFAGLTPTQPYIMAIFNNTL